MPLGKDSSGDFLKPIQAFAQPRADGFWIELQRNADFLVTQAAEIAQFNDLAARLAQLIESLPKQGVLFRSDERGIGRRFAAGRVEAQPGVGVFSVQGNQGLAAAPFGRPVALAIIPGFIGGNAKEPGLELAFALKRMQMLDDGKKGFLADFLSILTRSIMSKLKDESRGGGVVPIKQLVPGRRVTQAALRQQLALGL